MKWERWPKDLMSIRRLMVACESFVLVRRYSSQNENSPKSKLSEIELFL